MITKDIQILSVYLDGEKLLEYLTKCQDCLMMSNE